MPSQDIASDPSHICLDQLSPAVCRQSLNRKKDSGGAGIPSLFSMPPESGELPWDKNSPLPFPRSPPPDGSMRPMSPPHTHQASVSLFSPAGPDAVLGFRSHVCSSQGGAHHHPVCEGEGLPLYPLARMQWGPDGSVEGPGVEHIVPGTVLHLQSHCTLWEPLPRHHSGKERGWESSAARAARS